MVSFNLVPANLRTPAVVAEFSAERASAGLFLQPFKVLEIGQRIVSQSRATGTLVLAGQPDDGDKYVISDGTTVVTFEFDDDASVVETPTLRAVVIGVNLAATLTALEAAINAAAFGISALSVTLGTTVNLRADAVGTAQNVAITEPVNVSTNLSDTGLTGGTYTLTGTAASLEPMRIGSAQEAANFWGAGSHLHRQAIAFFANNSFSELWGVGLDDAVGGTKATGTLTITGPATGSGDLLVYAGGIRFAVAVASADTATEVAAALAAAINADTTAPYTAGASSGVVTLTAKNAGIVGNLIDLRVNHNPGEVLPAGLAVAIVAMSGGAGSVDLSLAFDAVGEEWFNIVISPYAGGTNLIALADELESRWGPLRAIESFGVVCATGDTSAVAAGAAIVNSGHLACVAAQGSPTWTVEIAAAIGATLAFYAAADPARPWTDLPLAGVLPPKTLDRWNLSQRNALLFAGVATTRVNTEGRLVIERIVTTYRTNAVGAADGAYLDANTHFTLSYLRFDLITLLRQRYARVKLASDETRLAAGQAVVTPNMMRAELIARAALWESLGLVEDLDQYKADLIVERNALDPTRLDFQIAPNLVNPLIVLAGRFTFVL